ncbi:30S ribosomal protein S4 [Candidatus Pacearchaeota archaeon]|nr:30S ribosomal protein S4 [Candidatus Pacearchaeota archaeon]
MIRKPNKFSWPRKLYDKIRIGDEDKLVEEYGLKNKREIWKAESKIKYFRNRAKFLIGADSGDQEKFFTKLREIGLSVNTIAEVLALTKEDLLKRRLATIVWKKGLANTAKHARQLIVHKKIFVGSRIINVPSYVVPISSEKEISLKSKAVPESSEKEISLKSKVQAEVIE